MSTTTDEHRQRHIPYGRTLLEVAVVLVVLGIVFSLLMIGLVDNREPFRRNQCFTQINDLAKAAIRYELTKRHFPGWLQSYGRFTGRLGDPSEPDTDPRRFAPHEKLGGWAIALLPYLDAQPTYEIWTDDRFPVVGNAKYTTHAMPNLWFLQCPNRTDWTDHGGRNTYVSNNGMHHRLPNGTIPTPLETADKDELASFVGSTKVANGVFNNRFATATIPAGDPVRMADLKDGSSYTVLFSENLQAFPWHQVQADASASAAALLSAEHGEDLARDPQASAWGLVAESRFLQGMVWHWQDDEPAVQAATGCPPVNAVHRINGSGKFGNTERPASDIDVAQLPVAKLAHVARPSIGKAHVDAADMQ